MCHGRVQRMMHQRNFRLAPSATSLKGHTRCLGCWWPKTREDNVLGGPAVLQPATSNQQTANSKQQTANSNTPICVSHFPPVDHILQKSTYVQDFQNVDLWKHNNEKVRTKPAKEKAYLALSCRIYLVIWVLRWLRGSLCNCTISMIRQEDVSHRIFQALWSCFHNKVVIFYSTLPCHYLHIIFLNC